MLRRLIRVTGIVLAIGTVAVLSAAGSAIGMVANGSFRWTTPPYTATVRSLKGSVIGTAKASSRLQLTGGVQMRLAGRSRAKVYQRRLVLEQGLGEMESADGFGESGKVAAHCRGARFARARQGRERPQCAGNRRCAARCA